MTKTEDIIAAEREYDSILQEVREEAIKIEQRIRDAELKVDAAKLDAIEQAGMMLEGMRLVPTDRIAMKLSHDFKGLIGWREVRECCKKLGRTNWLNVRGS